MWPEAGLAKFEISPITETEGKLLSKRNFADLFNSPTEIISLFCSTISVSYTHLRAHET